MNRYVTKGINVACRTIDGIAYIFNQDNRSLLELDKVGSFIWDQVDGCRTVSQIIGSCYEFFEGDEQEISSGVVDFIDILIGKEVAIASDKPFQGVLISAC